MKRNLRSNSHIINININDDFDERPNWTSRHIQYATKKEINDKDEMIWRRSKNKSREIEKLNLEIKELFMLTISQYEEMNQLKNELSEERSINMSLARELDRIKNSICQCKLNQEFQMKIFKQEVYLGESEFENRTTNIITNIHTKSTFSLKKKSYKNKSLYNSLEDFKLDDTNSIPEQYSSIKLSKEKYKFRRSSSVIYTPTFNTFNPDHKSKDRRKNISQGSIVFDAKKNEKDIDELFDDDMEKLINSLRKSKAEESKKNLFTLEKQSHNDTADLLSKVDKRKKLLVQFKANCKENKKMLKSMAKNTQSKVKGFLVKSSNQANGQMNSVDPLERLESDTVILHSSNTCDISVSKEKFLKKNKTKIIKFNGNSNNNSNKLMPHNRSASIILGGDKQSNRSKIKI